MAFVSSVTPLLRRSAGPLVSRARPVHLQTAGRARVSMAASGIAGAVGAAQPATGAAAELSLAALGAGGKYVILYFYPKDCTPGCTVEAQDFRDAKGELDALNAVVVGVSRDSLESHKTFTQKEALNFPLIADDGPLTEGFAVWKERNMFGKTFMGIERSTFILKDGEILKEWRGIKAKGHAAAVIAALKEIAAA